jgi:Family of unknown function (DUF6191)
MSFFEIFDPGMKYLREERERRRTAVANPTHGGGPPLGIDLDAGTASITIHAPRQAEPEPAAEADHGSDSKPA